MKNSTDVEQTPVTLIAYEYEWTCPHCGESNKCEKSTKVTCDYCENTFPVRSVETD